MRRFVRGNHPYLNIANWSLIGHCPLVIGIFLFFIVGCEKKSPSLILYTSVDQPVAASIIKEFEKQTGIHVDLVTDTEATKSVGLSERLLAEKDNPRADVWWGNEPFHTINLAESGVLKSHESPNSKDVPDRFKDSQHRWAGNGMRIRVIVINQNFNPAKKMNPGLAMLSDPLLKGQIAMARPTAGTTGGHVAAIYASMGSEKAKQFFNQLHDNQIKLLGGNSMVADSVGAGTMLAGVTDNDDAQAAIDAGGKLRVQIPDETLGIPITVGLVHDSPDARKLVDFLLSSQVEQNLIAQKFAYMSIRAESKVKLMDVNYKAVAKIMPEAIREAMIILEGR